jgi:hypothetical protein
MGRDGLPILAYENRREMRCLDAKLLGIQFVQCTDSSEGAHWSWLDVELPPRVARASPNDWDWEILRGQSLLVPLLHGLITPKVRVIGCDIAGRVAKVGEAVNALRVGDEVYGDLCMQAFGAFAEYGCAAETALARGSRPA